MKKTKCEVVYGHQIVKRGVGKTGQPRRRRLAGKHACFQGGRGKPSVEYAVSGF